MTDSTLEPFDMNDLERVVSDEAKIIMAETILAWADLDTGISYYTLLVFGLESDAGSILLGNMDLRTKVERIRALNEHHGASAGFKSLTRFAAGIKEFSFSRNIVAHRKCVGRMISQPARLVFMSAKHIKKRPGEFEILCVDHSELIASAKFARDAAKIIQGKIAAIEDSITK